MIQVYTWTISSLNANVSAKIGIKRMKIAYLMCILFYVPAPNAVLNAISTFYRNEL